MQGEGLAQQGLLAHVAHAVTKSFEAAAIFVVVLGTLLAIFLYVRSLGPSADFGRMYHELRGRVGRSILLALEFLVAADIIEMLAIQPTLRSLGVLAVVVLLRTLLSFTLEVEINGAWPWRMRRQEEEMKDRL